VNEQPNIVDGHGPDATSPPGPELALLVNELRRSTDLVVRPGATPSVLTEAAALVERAADLLEGMTRPWAPSVPARPLADLEAQDYFPFSPMIGAFSPLAPPIACERDGDGVRGHGVLGAAYEGPPGCVHGGIIAGLFDELLGVANIVSGVGAMTGTLTIVYRSPTPLYTELTLAGHTVSIDGRKVRTVGTLHAGDRLCAEADGVFILVDHQRFVSHTFAHGGEPAS